MRKIIVPDPSDYEVQIKTIASGICMFDAWNYKTGSVSENEIPGHEGIGIVCKVGKKVNHVKEGDLVTSYNWSEYCNVPYNTAIKLSLQNGGSSLPYG